MYWHYYNRQPFIAFYLFCYFICFISSFRSVKAGDPDYYTILGVARSASTPEIKQAYRRKARDTHPDKNKGVPPAEAAEAFRQVVHAFEVLSDPSSRQHYDRTGRDARSNNNNPQQQQQQAPQWQFRTFHWNFEFRPMKLKDKFEVQQAQSRVLHIVSLPQLQTIMLDENDLLERNLLLCVVTPGFIETHANDEMVFPYPFAHMSSQGIWWEDLLQTVQIRYNNQNALTKYLGIPHGDKLRQSRKPLFLFGKKHTPLTAESLTRLHTSNREEFEAWVWKQIEVPLRIINRHDHPVEVYWIHGTRAETRGTIPPHEMMEHLTMLAHEWYVRDARVDTIPNSPGRYKLTAESSLGSWKMGVESPATTVLADGTVELVIERQTCFDLSGHCLFWRGHGECHKNPRFMEETCRLSCKLCERDKPADKPAKHDEL